MWSSSAAASPALRRRAGSPTRTCASPSSTSTISTRSFLCSTRWPPPCSNRRKSPIPSAPSSVRPRTSDSATPRSARSTTHAASSSSKTSPRSPSTTSWSRPGRPPRSSGFRAPRGSRCRSIHWPTREGYATVCWCRWRRLTPAPTPLRSPSTSSSWAADRRASRPRARFPS